MANIQESMQRLQTAVTKLSACSGAKTGAMKGKPVAHFPAGNERDTIKVNLRELEQQMYSVKNFMEKAPLAEYARILQDASSIREKILGNYKIKEYTGKLSFPQKIAAFFSRIFHVTLYVGVGDHIVGKKEVDEKIKMVLQKVETKQKEEKTKTEEMVAAQKLAQEAVDRKAKEEVHKAEVARKKAEEEKKLTFEQVAASGLSEDAQKFREVVSEPKVPVFWVEKNDATKVVEVHVFEAGKKDASTYPVKDGKVAIGGVSYKNIGELKNSGFVSLSDVAAIRANGLAKARSIADVERDFDTVGQFLRPNDLLVALSKDKDENLFLSVKDYGKQYDHHELDLTSVPGKIVCAVSDAWPWKIELEKFDKGELTKQLSSVTSKKIFSIPDLNRVQGLQEEFEGPGKTKYNDVGFALALKNTPNIPVGAYFVSAFVDGKRDVHIYGGMSKEGEPVISSYTMDFLEHPGKIRLIDGPTYETFEDLSSALNLKMKPEEVYAGTQMIDSLNKSMLIDPDKLKYLEQLFSENTAEEGFKVWGLVKDQNGYAFRVYTSVTDSGLVPIVSYFDEAERIWKVKIAVENLPPEDVEKMPAEALASYSSLDEMAGRLQLGHKYQDLVSKGFVVKQYAGQAASALAVAAKASVKGASWLWTNALKPLGGAAMGVLTSQMKGKTPVSTVKPTVSSVPTAGGAVPEARPVPTIPPRPSEPPASGMPAGGAAAVVARPVPSVPPGVTVAPKPSVPKTDTSSESSSEELEETEETTEGTTEETGSTEEASSTVEVDTLAIPDWLDEKFASCRAAVVGKTPEETATKFVDLFERWYEAEDAVNKDFDAKQGQYHLLVEGIRLCKAGNSTIKKSSLDFNEAIPERLKSNFSMKEQFQLYELAKTKRGFRESGPKMQETEAIIFNILKGNKDEAEKKELKNYFQANTSRYAKGYEAVKALVGL
jgi:hypothetical protein